jgi:DHA2 family multidrug resistance protein
MSAIPRAEMGYATSLFNAVRNIGSSIGISFATTVVARRAQFHQQVLGDKLTPSNPISQQAWARLTPWLAHQGFDRVTAAHKAGGFIYQQLEQQAALLSFADAYFLLGSLFLVAIPVVFLMRGAERSPRQGKGP